MFQLLPGRTYLVVGALWVIGGIWLSLLLVSRGEKAAVVVVAGTMGCFFAAAIVLFANLSFLKDNFGKIFRDMVAHELGKVVAIGASGKDLRYHFEFPYGAESYPSDRAPAVGPGFYDRGRFDAVFERARGVDTDRYLESVLADLGIVEEMGERVKAELILEFVQRAMLHDVFGQAPLAHPVVLLEYGWAHCTLTNQYAFRVLLETAGLNFLEMRSNPTEQVDFVFGNLVVRGN